MSLPNTRNIREGTVGILRRGDSVLIIYRRYKDRNIRVNGPPDSWSFPGGAVDEGELSKETVVREFKEEVNLDVRVVSIEGEALWGETEDRLDDTWHCSFFVVEQIDSSQVPQVMESMKHVAVGWMRWDELWEGILAHINGNKEWRGTVEVIVDNRGTTEKRSERMSFFETMKNMAKEYPDRSDLACLEKHL